MKYILTTILLMCTILSFGQARIDINNNSGRTMVVKVMRGNGGQGKIYKRISIRAYGNETVYFSTSGNYFTKTKATIAGKNPVCRKGEPFHVVNDDSGYSVLTLTFSISESNVAIASGGVGISQSEFEKD
jgi:hypothetical protein